MKTLIEQEKEVNHKKKKIVIVIICIAILCSIGALNNTNQETNSYTSYANDAHINNVPSKEELLAAKIVQILYDNLDCDVFTDYFDIDRTTYIVDEITEKYDGTYDVKGRYKSYLKNTTKQSMWFNFEMNANLEGESSCKSTHRRSNC